MKKTKKNSKEARVANHPPLGTVPEEAVDRSLWQDPFIHLLLILIAGFAVYVNSVTVPFIFDDYLYLVQNPAIRSFDCFPDTQKVFNYSVFQDIKNNLILRPVAYFTFAVNYALHGNALFGYHLVNLLLHIGSAMLVYALFVQLLSMPALAGAEQPEQSGATEYVQYLPLFAALFFVCHPLQTQAVTYIVQRFVPLATLFYLAALVLYLQSRVETTPGLRTLTYVLAVIAAVLAMESKEIAFTLPLVIALVEFMFFRGGLWSRGARLASFFLTMAIIPAKLMQLPSSVTADTPESLSDAINIVNNGSLSSWEYFMTQFGVITTYIKLLFLPVRQNLDYDYPLQKHFLTPEVLLPLALLLLIIGVGCYFLKRSRENRLNALIAFGIFWFFITLSVESSIVPIEDVIFEHRAYLPSVGFFIALFAGVAAAFNSVTGKSIVQSKAATILLLVLVLGLSAAASARNSVWQDEVVFWTDVVSKSPNKARAHAGLAEALLLQASFPLDENDMHTGLMVMKAGSEKNLVACINACKEAIRLKQRSRGAHITMARALVLQKNYDEAFRSLAIVAELWPKSPVPYILRGEIFEVKKDYNRARQEYLAANIIQPLSYIPHVKLADIYVKEGDLRSAVKELKLVMEMYPDEAIRKRLNQLQQG